MIRASGGLLVAALAAAGLVRAQTCPSPAWDATPGVNHQTHDLVVFDDGGGRALYAATALGVAKWNGAAWQYVGTFGSGTGPSLGGMDLEVYDDGTGAALYVAGLFGLVNGVSANNVAKWNGTAWSALGPGVSNWVRSMAVFNGELYLAGMNYFTLPAAHGLHRWNGSTMTNVMAPVYSCGQPYPCDFFAAFTFDDGTGPALYLGGPGVYAPIGTTNWTFATITKWDGTSLSPVAGTTNDIVWTLGSYDDGSSTKLYAGGGFTMIDGVSASGIAARAGGTWLPLGPGVLGPGGAGSFSVRGIHSYNDGTGNRLYVAGAFAGSAGVSSPGIMSWDGSQWHGIGGGLAPASGLVGAERVLGFNDGTCSALYVGGWFSGSPTVTSPCVIRHRSASPALDFLQPFGPGTPVSILNASLVLGHDYHGVFSFTPCPGGPGSGPYAGLCAPNPAFLVDQLFFPLGTLPFYFTATATAMAFGPFFPIPGTPFSAGAHVEALTFDYTNGVLGCISSVGTLTVQ